MRIYCVDCNKIHEQHISGLEGTFPGICGVCRSIRLKQGGK